jgi:hypothetical protein
VLGGLGGLLKLLVSRNAEYGADAAAVAITGTDAIATALIKLEVRAVATPLFCSKVCNACFVWFKVYEACFGGEHKSLDESLCVACGMQPDQGKITGKIDSVVVGISSAFNRSSALVMKVSIRTRTWISHAASCWHVRVGILVQEQHVVPSEPYG